MKIAISVLSVALLAAVLLLWNRSNNDQDTRQETVRTHGLSESPVLDRSKPGDHSRERPRLPSLPTPGSSQASPAESVAIDRRPFDPTKESDTQYQRRVRLATAFDQFREESGISEEKTQAVLALLYDYQETARYVRKQDLDRVLSDDNWKESDYESRKALHTSLLVKLDARDALEEILTPEEMRPWRRHMESSSVFMLLNWPYEPPLIVPVE